MHDFNSMIIGLENGQVSHRSDWGYRDDVKLTLMENQFKTKSIYITNTLRCVDVDSDLIGYGITYDDIKSKNWVLSAT